MLGIFQRNHGHCLVPYSRRAGSLGHWVARQQAQHQQGHLSAARIRRLQQLGFVFQAGGQTAEKKGELEARWDRNFTALIEFKRIHGHFSVPRRVAAHKALGVWVESLRKLKRSDRLREDRRRRLEGVQFTWDVQASNWDRKFAELGAYKKRFGHCDVPARWSGNRALGSWIDHQRWWRDGRKDRHR